MLMTKREFQGLVLDLSVTTGYPEWIALRQIEIESNWQTDVVSSDGAIGIAQVLPTTAAQPGFGIKPFNPTDPEASINFLFRYMLQIRARTRLWSLALCAYNVGLHAPPQSASPAYRNLAAYVRLALNEAE